MIITSLIALFIMLFGDHNLPFLLPSEEKAINKVIDDKVKHKKLDFIVEGIESKEEQYKKDKKAYTKELEDLNLNRGATAAQFNQIADNIRNANNDAFYYMVKVRLTIAQVITPEEWNLILEESRGRFKKSVKKYEKVYPKFEKEMDNIIKRIENTLENKDNAEIIVARLRGFSARALKNSKELSAINVYEHPVLSNIESTEEELLTVVPEIIKLQSEVVDEYIAIHNLLVKLTTEKEWPKIIKKVNKLF